MMCSSRQVKFPVNITAVFINADRRCDMINWYERPVFKSSFYNRQPWCVKAVRVRFYSYWLLYCYRSSCWQFCSVSTLLLKTFQSICNNVKTLQDNNFVLVALSNKQGLVVILNGRYLDGIIRMMWSKTITHTHLKAGRQLHTF